MILEIENWHLGYSQILSDTRAADGGSVLLICNADADAMAAARIFAFMLRSDSVAYKLVPCRGYMHLQKILQETSTDDVSSVVMLNLGATRNLTHLFDEGYLQAASQKLFIIDCRRPVHLANVHAGDSIVVFWDQIQNEDVPSDGDELSAQDTSEEEDDSDEDSDEAEEALDHDSDEEEHQFEDDDDVGEDQNSVDLERSHASSDESEVPASPRRDVDQDQESDYDAEDERDIDAPRSPRSPSHKRLKTTGTPDTLATDSMEQEESPTQTGITMPTLTPREIHQDRRNRVRAYYSSGSFFGSPASFIAHTVATQLRFGENGDLLWLACVGVTDAFLHSRLDLAGYTSISLQLRTICSKLFPNDMYHRVGSATYAEHLVQGDDARGDATRISFSENGKIISEPDFRFFLLRHTSLFDAMVYSDYVSTRFRLSTPSGMRRLQELLAKMGFPLEECHQPFAFMKHSLRRRLREQIHEHAEEYDLDDIEYTSFFRITGYQSRLSAADTSYAVTALLECDTVTMADEEEQHTRAFNVAFDALNSNAAPSVSLTGLSGEGNNLVGLVNGGNMSSTSGLGAGIRLAMSLQRSIMSTAASLIDRCAITRLSHFRYAYITCTSRVESQRMIDFSNGQGEEDQQHHVFAKPLTLTRLAHYLMDIHRENGKWTGTKARPLILLAEKPITKTFLIAGYEYPETAGEFIKNKFCRNFEVAAQSMKGDFKLDSFDSNVIEVGEADAQRFIEQLHYLLDEI